MRTDHWDDTGKTSSVNEHPTAHDVSEALARLDGDKYTELSIEGPDATLIGGGGGPDQFFFNFLLAEDQGEWVLSENPEAVGATSLAIGRNLADYPSKHVVGRDTAKKALIFFLQNNERDQRLNWLKTF